MSTVISIPDGLRALNKAAGADRYVSLRAVPHEQHGTAWVAEIVTYVEGETLVVADGAPRRYPDEAIVDLAGRLDAAGYGPIQLASRNRRATVDARTAWWVEYARKRGEVTYTTPPSNGAAPERAVGTLMFWPDPTLADPQASSWRANRAKVMTGDGTIVFVDPQFITPKETPPT